jgi:hypothetical protein
MFCKTYSKNLLEAIGLKQSLAGPCIWYKQDNNNQLVLVIAIHVDDFIMAGLKSEIATCKKDAHTRFKISNLGLIKKCPGVWYKRCKDKDGAYFKSTMKKYQDDIISEWEQITGKKCKPTNTPGFPGESLTKNTGDEIDKENYSKILGRLMWFLRKLMPECGNVISLNNPAQEHWRAMGLLVGSIASCG